MTSLIKNTLKSLSKTILAAIILIGLYILSRYSYLAFHMIAENFSIIVAFGMFMLAWNSREFNKSNYITILGIGYLFIGLLDLIHTMSYSGMNVFPGYDSNLPTQLWICARYLESITLFSAPFFINKKIKLSAFFIAYLTIAIAIIISVFAGIFPDCFVRGSGLTSFKIVSEYIISIILIGSLIVLYKQKKHFSKTLIKIMFLSILITVFAEISFTFYISTYGISNFVGHIFKLISFYLIYKAIIVYGLKKPYSSLFKDYQRSEKEYQDLVSNVPGITYHCLNDSTWTMKFISDEVEVVSGYPASDFIDNQVRTFTSIIHPEDIDSVFNSVLVSLKKRESYVMNYRIITSAGDVRWVYEKGKGIYNDSSEIEYLDGVILDVTQLKEAEETAASRQILYESLLNNMPFPIMLINSKKVVMAANKPAIKKGAKIGDYCWKKFMHGDYLSPENKKRALTEPDHPGIQCIFCKKDKALSLNRTMRDPDVQAFGEIWDTYWIPISNDSYLHFAIDLTQQKKAEEVLKKKVTGLKAFNDIAVDRELKINELRKEVNSLLKRFGDEEKYTVID